MLLITKYHGTIEYNEEDIITFKKGLPGFESLKKFIVVPFEDNEVFSILISLEDTEVAIPVISPFHVDETYEFKLSDEKINELNVNSQEDILVLNTVTLNSNVKNITINMKAPIIINIKGKIGEQIILDNEKYRIKKPLFKEESSC
ncbi:flagellar assembly protein FliW [Clostridium sp. HMP27]|uniref:flagellar assembly protein FliW n=1 Tax=Clostridium sp. HMP27 TaxID=1487921 RepID=UPI00052BBE58|nr:flagellar assembly protein FliW [Clostridium sp. HMP27]KGK86053.1 flagellar assembly protein FliW [Clostridium sp. HMP27]